MEVKYLDTNRPMLWHSSELRQQVFYDYAKSPYKYQLWTRARKNIFLYASPIVGANICRVKNYVRLGETYNRIEDDTLLCSEDILI